MRRLLVGVSAAAAILAACGAAEDAAQQAQLVETTTTRPPLPDGACLAWMKNLSPEQGGTNTVIIDSHFPSVAATIAVHYKSKDTNYSAQLDGNGHAEAEFSIGHPTANFPVKVDVNVNGQETCNASFTPR